MVISELPKIIAQGGLWANTINYKISLGRKNEEGYSKT